MKAFAFGMICLFIAGSVHADPQHRKTLALISMDTGPSANAIDVLTAKLSENQSIQLVERAAIDRVLREQALASAGLTVNQTEALGRLVGADILVLIGQDPQAGGDSKRMLLCDCATGTRIGQLRFSAKADAADFLTAEILATLARFPDGVKSVVAVPDLLSRDLRFTHAGLQTALAEIVRDALARQQGIAVVELDEAKEIAKEKDLVGGEVRRINPLFVEGEYRTDDRAEGGAKISIKFSLKTAQGELSKLASGDIRIDDASRFILQDAYAKVVESFHQAKAKPFDLSQEFERLSQRADQFAEVGDFQRSADIREAALLLQPGADEQRVRLVREYVRWNQRPVEVVPQTARKAGEEFWAPIVARSRETWRRSLSHVEYLVRNQRVDLKTGTELFSSAIQSIARIRATRSQMLGDEETLKKEFVRSVAPSLYKLKNSNNSPAAALDQRASTAYGIYNQAFFRVDGNLLREDDLQLIGDLLCDLLPEDTPVAAVMLYRLRDGTRMFGGTDRDVTAEAWTKFAKRLNDSPRPLVKAYGRYALLCDRHYRRKEVSEELLAEAESLALEVQKPSISQLDPGKFFRQATSDTVVWLRMALHPKAPAEQRPAPIVKPAASPQAQADGSLSCERIVLKPVEIMVAKPGRPPVGLTGQRWRAAGGSAGWRELVPAWDNVDAIFSYGALLLVGPDRTAREVLVDEKLCLSSVVFDGKYLWASAGYDQGVYVIDKDGKTVAHIGGQDGLPEAYVSRPLHVLSEGRVMAGGSIGQTGRGWLATIELINGKAKVNVFHEAVKAWQYRDTPFEQIMDPAMRFGPDWITEHTDEKGKRWLFVDRRHLPLLVDPDNLQVSVYPARKLFDTEAFPRQDDGTSVFLSHSGLFYVAGSHNDFGAYRMDPQTHRFKQVLKPDDQWHYGNATAGSIVEHEGYLYYAGEARWLRYKLDNGPKETLLASPRSLPDFGAGGGWALRVSRCFGLVAWYQGKLYQVSINPTATITPTK